MKIIFTKRDKDIHACLEGRPGVWAAGKTQNEALGNLIRDHLENFGFELEWNMDDDWTKRYVDGDPLTRNDNERSRELGDSSGRRTIHVGAPSTG